ncbi:MAG TPA: adenylosuccinate synthase [Opitutae bacterium]|nr:adenylosuccinate synthase [Opitutae bacterium]|tara:strand:+ start:528 stop:2087 length:1560 start_codon:yes stop_codon:yes gene_type:complete
MTLTPFSSQLIADVGISAGDEGKGRVVYEVINELKESTEFEDPVRMVLKVNGGANSGHTAGGLKLNLIPAGVVDLSVAYLGMGAGVVADPRKIHWEAKALEHLGFSAYGRLAIDERTLISDVTHRVLDLCWESYRVNVLNDLPRGSTGRGISPAYAEEVGQWQIYYGDFLGHKDAFVAKMKARLERAERLAQHVCQVDVATWDYCFKRLTEAEIAANQSSIEANIFPDDAFDFTQFKGKLPFKLNHDTVIGAYWDAGVLLKDRILDIREIVLHALYDERFVLGEFGQSYWLDKRHGFSPCVTASHTYTPEFFESAGVPVQPIHTLGVCKAYDTKVGTHVFLTSMPSEHPLGERLKKLEFGTSTGRQRSVGWFDAVEKGDALRYGGFQDLVMNKLDALSYGDDWQGGELLVCVAYRDENGQLYHHVPRDDAKRTQLTPVYQQMPGWSEDITGVRYFEDLPEAAKDYVACVLKAIVSIAGRHEPRAMALPNIRYIGVGPEPSQIIRDVPDASALLERAKNF